ncbi:hypothetical protein GGI12_005674, partial [Dipsacomyces acuminosporus]
LLRRTFISRYVAIEKNIHAHKIAAYTVCFWTIAHVVTYYYKWHLTVVSSKGRITYAQKLFGNRTGLTGHLILFFLALLFATSIPAIRRKFHEVFYWSHHLFLPITALFFVHGSASSFQNYFAGPGAIYVADRIYRLVRSRIGHPRILSVIQHPSNVIELRIEKRRMRPQVGQYIYINVPSISWLQWHPFTLTSAPEEDELTLHIWVAGDWTRRLVQALQACAVNPPINSQISGGGGGGAAAATATRQGSQIQVHSPARDSSATGYTARPTRTHDVPGRPANPKTLSALADQELLMHHLRGEIDPVSGLPKPGVPTQYSTQQQARRNSYRPWSRVGRNSTVLLDRLPPEMDFRLSGTIAYPAGTNPLTATVPLISLPKIMVDGPYGAPTQQVFSYQCVVLIGGGIGVTPMSSVLKSLYYQLIAPESMRKIRKVYFLWVCRDVQSLEWFQDLLAALDEEDIGDMLEIRTYLTGQLSVDQIRNIALYHDPQGPDAITGLYRSPTYYGRPNFNRIFSDIGMRNPNTDIGVFFCGPKAMARTVRKLAGRWTKNLRPSNTKFVFHKENF